MDNRMTKHHAICLIGQFGPSNLTDAQREETAALMLTGQCLAHAVSGVLGTRERCMCKPCRIARVRG